MIYEDLYHGSPADVLVDQFYQDMVENDGLAEYYCGAMAVGFRRQDDGWDLTRWLLAEADRLAPAEEFDSHPEALLREAVKKFKDSHPERWEAAVEAFSLRQWPEEEEE